MSLGNMLPVFSSDDRVNSCMGNTKLMCQLCINAASSLYCLKTLTYLKHLCLCEFDGPLPSASGTAFRMSPGPVIVASGAGFRMGKRSMAFFLNHIVHIVFLRAYKQVVRANTMRNITVMQDTQAIGNSADVELPRKTMRSNMTPWNSKGSIPSCLWSNPKPTRGIMSLRDVRPKPLHYGIVNAIHGCCTFSVADCGESPDRISSTIRACYGLV